MYGVFSVPSYSGVLVLLDLLFLSADRAVVLLQVVRVLLVRRLLEEGLLPQVRGQVGVGLGDGGVRGLGEVSKRASGALGRGVTILDTSHLQELLGDGGRHNTGSARRRDEPHPDGATLASHLGGDGVGLAELVAPETPPHWDDRQLGEDDGSPDGSGHLLGALDSQPDMAVVVPNGDKSLEAGSLSGTGLLLHRHDLQHIVLKGGPEEEVNDLKLLYREREEVNLLEGLDLAILDEAAQLGHRDPLLLLLAFSTSSLRAASPTAPTATKTSSETTTIGGRSVRHVGSFDLLIF